MAVSSLPESLHKDFLECGLCKGEYDTPKILPCLHTFCLTCLNQHIGKNTTAAARLWFLCPQCKAITDLPADNTKGFKTNTFVLNLKKFAQLQVDKHHKNSVETLEELQNDKGRRNSLKNCELGVKMLGECREGSNMDANSGAILCLCSCRLKEVRFYCETCEVLTCPSCVTERHKTHDMILVEDKANKEKDRFINSIHNTKKEILQLNEGISDIEKYKISLRSSRNGAVTNVQKHAALLRKLIDQEETKILKSIEDIFTQETEKSEKIIKENTNVAVILKSLSEFSNCLLQKGSDSQIIIWSGHAETQVKAISQLSKKYAVEKIRKNPIEIKYKEKELNHEMEIKKLLGEAEYGVNVNILSPTLNDTQNKINKYGRRNSFKEDDRNDVFIDAGNPLLQYNIHRGMHIRSISAFSNGSFFSPSLVGIASTPRDDIIVVDKNNKCVKIFGPDGGIYKKIHGSDNLWGVTVLPDGNYAITDKTVHIFDTRGKLVRVLRQQPRDSHGIAINSVGDIIVSDCMSRCIYVLSSVGGTIKRIITQRGKGPFKCPANLAINNKDQIIVSDCGLNTVSIFSDKGQFVREFGIAGKEGSDLDHLDCPSGVCCDKQGNIFICDKNNDRIVMLDPQGHFLCVLLQGSVIIHRPQAVTVNSQGHIAVAEEDGKIKFFRYKES